MSKSSKKSVLNDRQVKVHELCKPLNRAFYFPLSLSLLLPLSFSLFVYRSIYLSVIYHLAVSLISHSVFPGIFLFSYFAIFFYFLPCYMYILLATFQYSNFARVNGNCQYGGYCLILYPPVFLYTYFVRGLCMIALIIYIEK